MLEERHTWLCTLQADLQPQNLALASTWKFAPDQSCRMHVVKTAMVQSGAACDHDESQNVLKTHGTSIDNSL